METTQITDKDGRFKAVVKTEFLKECPNPSEQSAYDLLTKYKLNKYLHNTVGPAVTRVSDGMVEYWVDGLVASPEMRERIIHKKEFTDNLEAIVNEK